MPRTAGRGEGRSKPRYFFFLNPFIDDAFSRCPKCEAPTKVRKFCLMVCVEPHHFVSLNKTCRFCPGCDLIIGEKVDLDPLIRAVCERHFPYAAANPYTVFGTMGRPAWRRGLEQPLPPGEGMEHTAAFKGLLNFETRLPRWIKSSGAGATVGGAPGPRHRR